MFKKVKYTNKETAPHLWHSFSRFVRAPYGFLQGIADLGANGLNIFTLLDMIFQTIFFVGSFKWKHYAYTSVIVKDIIAMISALFTLSLASNDPFYIGLFLATCFSNGLEIYYYKKREGLFDGKKY